jgi:glycosyltransferase involved in cell wall biosynthesis
VTSPAALLAAAVSPFNAYLLVLLGAAVRGRRQPPPAARAGPPLRFAILVPARDEEAAIAATLSSLRALAYPRERVRIVVLADNCTDRTADVARAAGAAAWTRRGGEAGKGAALAWGLERLARTGPDVDAVVIVDADCSVAPNLLAALERRLRDGAQAVQVAYGVANPDASPVAALRHASFVLVNGVRPLGKTTLGLSAGLLGTGMAFSRDLLARRSWTARSLAEDQEQHLALVADGERVVFAAETGVTSPMPTSLRRSRDQQLRWDAGRGALVRRWTPALLRAGVRHRDGVKLHAALEPFVPPQSLLLAVNAAGWLLALRARPATRRLALANLGGQCAFVLGGLALMRAPAPVWRSLAFAPVLAAWKLGLLARLALGKGPTTWVRTEREAQPAAERTSRRPMRRSWSRRTYARSSGSARGAP